MEEENKEYLELRLKDIMEPMIAQALLKRPKNVAKFMLNWLKEKYNRTESDSLKNNSENEESNDVSVWLIGKEDEAEPIPLPKRPVARRMSVSAEVYGQLNKRETPHPHPVPKTEAQKQHILQRLKDCLIFNALDKNELEVVVDAIEERKCAKDEVVINQGGDGEELCIVESGTLSCSRKLVCLRVRVGRRGAKVPEELPAGRSIWCTSSPL
eukprot:TRINITY_DN4939_c0_g1_i3.p1 TRINITY_DN4939_c0_g1~~TRINITY_DN4939_c0_g1_i3.p1  ORF type:complete len:212 (+),score=60.60 TRINITY_DN4939_c0_g1_i3:185-820(+)